MRWLNFILLSLFLLNVSACGKEDKHLEKSNTGFDSNVQQKLNTSLCGADWDGDNGDLVFPGLVTQDECEALCEPIYQELIESNGTGYCQFGAERIWELPYYQE